MQRLRQLTFASLECDRKTRREIFPERMDGLITWERLEARIAPTHPKGGGKGRQPHPLPAMEDLLCEAESVRRFVGVGPEKVPDETMIPTSATGWSAADWRTCCFGRSGITWPGGGVLKKGSIIEATIILAPSSTGNESNALGPEMHWTRKGNRRHFGMKLHVGNDPRGWCTIQRERPPTSRPDVGQRGFSGGDGEVPTTRRSAGSPVACASRS